MVVYFSLLKGRNFRGDAIHNIIHRTRLVGWLEFNVPFQHKYGYIRDEYIEEVRSQ